MIENNEIAKALGQLPELVGATKTLIEDNARKDEIIGRALQNRIQAEIPAAEVDKVASAAAEAIARTRCAVPDVSQMGRILAKDMMEEIHASLSEEIQETIGKEVRELPVRHIHEHTTLKEMCGMAEERLRRSCQFVQIINVILVLAVSVLAVSRFASKEHIGKRYADIATSKYTTEEERVHLMESAYPISFLPDEYDKTPSIVRQRIRRNKQILKQRKHEARANKGNFSTRIPLE